MDYYNPDLPVYLAPDKAGRYPYTCTKPDCWFCEIMAEAQLRSRKSEVGSQKLAFREVKVKGRGKYRPITIDIKRAARIIISGVRLYKESA